MNIMTTLEKNGKILAVGFNYLTDDNRIILRAYTGLTGSTLSWYVNGWFYRNLWEAYDEVHYCARPAHKVKHYYFVEV